MDIAHTVGSDLALGTTGDLATSDGTIYVRERVLRRLMTNAGGYIWNLTYGGGLPSFVGTPVNAAAIDTTIRDQMTLEAAVARSPVPSVGVVSDAGGTVTLTVTYSDVATGAPQTLTITPGS